MKSKRNKLASCFAALIAVSLSISASAQTFVRYVLQDDIGTHKLYSNDVLPSVLLPCGVSRVDNNKVIHDAAHELMDILRNDELKLLYVYVCGSASPDGNWQFNVKLSSDRTNAAAEYLNSVTGVPLTKIHKESLNEDWDRLYELIEDSDIIYRQEILEIIRTSNWSERKQELKQLGGGRVWRILLDDFFPKLRCVRIAFFCQWDESKPYLTAPETAEVKRRDTLFIKDTAYFPKERIFHPVSHDPGGIAGLPEPAPCQVPERMKNLIGLKTNLICDGLGLPTLGAEFQISRKLSVDIQGTASIFNIFNTSDKGTRIYGFSPEIRYWLDGSETMRRGHFVGVHANGTWYKTQWKNGLLYQNGPESIWEEGGKNAGLLSPAWSTGFTYGYSLGLDKKAGWRLEFLIGVGYGQYDKNVAVLNNGVWKPVEFQHKHHFGLTRLGINLAYRLPTRKRFPDVLQK